jgi:hypothetical protein
MAWINLGSQLNDLNELDALIKSIEAPVDVLMTATDVGLQALDIGKVLLLGAENIAAAALSGAVTALEQSITEILECNVSTMVHINANWDPTWSAARFKASGDLPWSGSGLQGWARDVGASLSDTSDPRRPLSDATTNVWGIVMVSGISNAGAVEDLAKLGRAFGMFSDFADPFKAEKLKVYLDDYAALSRLGPAFMDPVVQGATGAKSTWEAYTASFGETYAPVAGAYPKWFAVPVTQIIPATDGVFRGMRNVVGGLRPVMSQMAIADALISALKARVKYIQGVIEKIEESAELLVALTTFMASASIYVIKTNPGEGKGIASVLAEAANDPDAPNYGPTGIVGGIAFFATSGSPQAPVEAFFTMLGMNVKSLSDDITSRTENLEQTYGELFPP